MPGKVVSKTLVQNDYVSMTIFSFDKGEEISTHAAGGDAMVTVLEGKGRFTVGGEVFYVEEGETLIMPKDIPHAVYGCIYRLCETNIHAGGTFLPFVFRILPLELGENMMVPIGWTGSLSVLFMRPLVISWKEKRCLRLIAGRWRR